MKKTHNIILIALLFTIIFLPFVASAHIEAKDGQLSAELHIDPGDSAIVGSPAHLEFEFADSPEKLDFTKCGCMVTISSGNSVLFGENTTADMFERVSTSLALTYTFPAKGTYSVILHGKNAEASSFMLSYNVVVDRNTPDQSFKTVSNTFLHLALHHSAHIFIYGGGFLVGCYLWWKQRKLEKALKKSLEENKAK